MATFSEKYKNMKWERRTIVAAAKRTGRTINCSICNEPYTDRVSKEAKEIICPYCHIVK